MKSNEIVAELQKKGDKEEGLKMAKYMRNKFLFLGVHLPEIKLLVGVCGTIRKQIQNG